ncbi:exonuclease III [Erysipelotrichaceae bacterium]|nr:exonuclease III [Erysipelotrichaceae bacterium]
MKFISWNVNGLRAVSKKGFDAFFVEAAADFFCVQEIKLQAGQIDVAHLGYDVYWNYAEKKGYSGTAIFTKHPPISIKYGLGIEHHDKEGRVITLEYGNFYLVTVYTPNTKRDLSRLDYRMQWEDDFRAYLEQLDMQKPVIFCGDFNVAHTEIDIKNANSNKGNSGFTMEERNKYTTLLASGFTDTYRYFYPDEENVFTWWSYMANVRARNIGWRLDYFCTSSRLDTALESAKIYAEVLGSDHCPVGLIVDNLEIEVK